MGLSFSLHAAVLVLGFAAISREETTRSLLKELVEINTSESVGSTFKAAEYPDSDVQRALEVVISDPKVLVRPDGEARNSPPSPLTPDLMSQIERISGQLWPGLPIIPTMSTGATDGLPFRNAGIPTYGVSGLFYGDTNAHGMNERVPAEGFYQGLEFRYRPGIS